MESAELYCSDACLNVRVVRSFGECPDCRKRWNGQSGGEDRHYRNNAWKICDTCARQQKRCVVCGSAIVSK